MLTLRCACCDAIADVIEDAPMCAACWNRTVERERAQAEVDAGYRGDAGAASDREVR